jgi:hypothetical protein
MGFMTTLLAILVAAGFQRRDREQQIWLMLFSKPLGYGSYLIGRWAGLVIGLLAGLLLMAAGGTLGLVIGLGRMPAVRAVDQPQAWSHLDVFASEQALHGSRVKLSGPAGDGVRFRFVGLDPAAGDAELLLRAEVRHSQPGWPLRRARVTVMVYPEGGDPSQATRLQVSPDSPYGQSFDDGRPVALGEALLTDRASTRDDLEEDYLRLQLPAALMAPSLVVQVLRLEEQATVSLDRAGSALISRPAGGFLLNVFNATLVITAQAGMLAAVAALVACVSNLGVTLLAGLTVFFAGHSHDLIDQVLRRGEYHRVVGRLFELIQLLIPDLQYAQLPVHLAGGHAVGWSVVLEAWGYYGIYTAMALFLAWLIMRRRIA